MKKKLGGGDRKLNNMKEFKKQTHQTQYIALVWILIEQQSVKTLQRQWGKTETKLGIQ